MVEPTRGAQRALEPPSCDDRVLWDLWLSQFHLPAVVVADELQLFAMLDEKPLSVAEVVRQSPLSATGAGALLAVLTGLGLLRQLGGKFHLTEPAREFLVPGRPYYWGGVLDMYRVNAKRASHERVRDGLCATDAAERHRATALWRAGTLPGEVAQRITDYMHAQSFPCAVGFSRRADLTGVRRLLDVGGGSGCFSIAVSLRHPQIRCTVMDLASVCSIAQSYIERYGLSGCITTAPVDFLHEDWPRGHDAILFSNILHDWDEETCLTLLKRAFDVLPSGGRLFLHEMVLGDAHDHDVSTATYSLQMATGTHGKQMTLHELCLLLHSAGFGDPLCHHSFSHHWTLTASRP